MFLIKYAEIYFKIVSIVPMERSKLNLGKTKLFTKPWYWSNSEVCIYNQ